MLLPQTRVGIAERRRPDFVAFVPLQYWNYKWVAIQLDGAHTEDQAISDKQRDTDLIEQGYEVIPIGPTQTNYLREVQRLVEIFEDWMNLAKEKPSDIAFEAEVSGVESDRLPEM